MVNVVYACNDMYVRQTIVSMVSVLKHNPEAKIYLIGDEISFENKKLVQRILKTYDAELTYIDIEKALPPMEFDKEDRHPKTIYVKLFFENVISEDRLLYLDSDVIVTDSLDSLFSRDMEHELIAGVLMPYSSALKKRSAMPVGHPYICDGVVLFNMKLWKREKRSEDCYKHICNYHGKPPMLSEGTLNLAAQGKIGVLKPVYNLMPSMIVNDLKQIKKLFKPDFYYEYSQDIDDAKNNPIIIHFMNELYSRPWHEDCSHPFCQRYRNIEKQIFGVNQIDGKGLSKHTQVTVWLRSHLPFAAFSAIYHIKNRI